MKLPIALLCVAFGAVAVHAQKNEIESKTKIEVKGGKDVTVTGCIEPMAGASGFILTHVADKSGELPSYALVSDHVEFAKHVGHRVQLNGKATDRGDAKVTVETKTKTKVEHGDDHETKSTTESSGNLDLPYLGVDSLKMIAAVCP